MIRHIFVFIVLLFGLAACTHKSSQSTSIVIENSDFDFGVVPDTIQILRHSFKIENKSSDSCHIIKIEKMASSDITPFSSIFFNYPDN